MYLPVHFAWTERTSLLAFCRDHSFATIVAVSADGPEAQHLPLLIDEEEGRVVLRGHAALADPLWRADRALAVFAGPHAYVSAAWYAAPGTVPTWNYLAVHARGPLRTIDDPAEVRDCFTRLGAADPDRRTWEAALGEQAYARLAAAVRWFRIDVEQLEGKAKLSQNHSAERRQLVIDRLRNQDDPQARQTGDAMARTLAGGSPWPPG